MENTVEPSQQDAVLRRRNSTGRWIEFIKKNYFLYVLLAPALLLTIIFKYVPMYGAIIAFKDFSPIKGILGSEWVGLKHFEKFLSSPNFDVIFMNTLKLSFFGLIFSFPVPILLALMLNQLRKAAVKKTSSCFYTPQTSFRLLSLSECCSFSFPDRPN